MMDRDQMSSDLGVSRGERRGTVLGLDVDFKGSLSFKDDLRVDGKFEGEITSPGAVHIGEKGDVKAEVTVGTAIVEGRVQGNITAKDKIELRATARMNGNIKTSRLVIQEGVAFVGNCEVNPSGGKIEILLPEKQAKQAPSLEEHVTAEAKK